MSGADNNAGEQKLFATLNTNKGAIVLKLFPDKTPVTVQNFVELAEGTRKWTDPETGEETTRPLYNGTIFHRVISGFMIQGGDPLGTGRGGPGYKFKDEFDRSLSFNRPYLLGMANAGAGTNGSQFFITVSAQPHLTGRHTIFGEVVEGREVVDAIAAVPVSPPNHQPKQDVVIESVTVERR